ncbi:MAG: cupin domain-containing protein [Candidatus Bathyarchaeia archaeon]
MEWLLMVVGEVRVMPVVREWEVDFWEVQPGLRGKVLAVGERSMMLYGVLERGASFPEHSHPHEQIGFCLKGRAEFKIGEGIELVEEGSSYWIPPNAPHYVRNVGEGDFVFVEVFTPLREDLLGRRFGYLRR